MTDRISALRSVMRRESIDAFIFPSTDPHSGEYVPDHWKGREWISGFNGSAGTAVVTLNEAALWTDSRYFIAAAEQLQGTGIELMKDGIEGTPSISQWLGRKLSFSGGTCVGIDGMVMSANEVDGLISELRKEGGITVRTNFDPLAEIWKDRPDIPFNPIEIQPIEYAGESAQSKLGRIRQAIRARHSCGMLVSTLDDIAWTLNLRGTDVHCNPVFVSYLLFNEDTSTLFVNNKKLTKEVSDYLESINVKVEPYENVRKALKEYKAYNIIMDKATTCHTLYNDVRAKVENCENPIPAMKAIKNETEVRGFREAMKRDGVALVKFLRWLKPAGEKGEETELSVAKKLTSLRAEQPLYRDISFDTISAYQEHGAIVHYEPTSETDKPLSPKGFLLLDSGAQYQDATTDIT